ncbi:FAD-dependent oxidoreductase [Myxococcota bacterium]|nr:FAD-dependent oxidoreductase [Myxococcota bacterium]
MSVASIRASSRALPLAALALSLTACRTTGVPPAANGGEEVSGPPARVVIVGGGLAGLVAAYELQKQGITSHILEGSEVWGGKVQTAYYSGGLDAEFGMQEMWKGNPLLDIAKELGVALDGEPEPAYSSFLLDGKIVPFVQDTVDAYFASFLAKEEVARLQAFLAHAKELLHEAETVGLKSPRVAALQDKSFVQWLEDEALPEKAREWVRLTLECELGAPGDAFSALAGLLELHIFLDANTPNYRVLGGNSKLIEALVGATRAKKTLSAMVTGVRRGVGADGKGSVTVQYIKNRVRHEVTAERVIMAIPFVRLHAIDFDPPLPPERWEALRTLDFGRYTVVHFIIDKAATSLWTIDGASVPPVLTDGPLGVIYGVRQEAPAGQPNQVFGLLVYGGEAGSFHMRPRDQKKQELLAELEKYWPGFSKYVKETHFYTYHPAALAMWPVGRSPLDAGSALWRTPDQGVHFAGDWTLGSHSDHAAKSGKAAAEQVAEALGAGK